MNPSHQIAQELLAIALAVSEEGVADMHVNFTGQTGGVHVAIYGAGIVAYASKHCLPLIPDFRKMAYVDGKYVGIGETLNMDELLANVRAYLAEYHNFAYTNLQG